MKKIVSIILAVVMMFSFTVVAFAANDTVSLGEVKSVSIKNNGYKRFDFTRLKQGFTLSMLKCRMKALLKCR